MGYYKVPQDVEAEDKLLGPFTFKQFIFIIITFIAGFVAFQLAAINILAALPLLPLIFVTALIGFYKPKDQPIENKVLAYLNFTFKPRKRIWSRDSVVDQVYIKAPKKVEVNYSDGRTQEQVRSQLKQLAQIVDTRGWSTKRSDIQEPVTSMLRADDRLIQPNQVTVVNNDPSEISQADDIYDEGANPVAQAFEQQTVSSEKQSREELIARLRQTVNATASSNQQTQMPSTYVNPYATGDDIGEDSSKPDASQEPDSDLHQRLKELESNSELPISAIAARAQELTIEHDDTDELKIEH